MPEGPSIVILKEQISPLLKGKKILRVSGNAKIAKNELVDKKVRDIRTWGKQILLCFPNVTIRIHLLLFGTYSVDEKTRADKSIRLCLSTKDHRVFFYTCAVTELPENIEDLYDWEADVMSDDWNPLKARKKLKETPQKMVCDALLDQQIFSGVGNIIKNEVLYRLKIHPETRIKNLPPRQLSLLVTEARKYSFDFLRWKKENTLKKHWLAHTKKTCVRCGAAISKKYAGKTKRRTFYCANCQIKY